MSAEASGAVEMKASEVRVMRRDFISGDFISEGEEGCKELSE